MGEAKVFYHKMKGDYYRYIAEFTDGDKKSGAANCAKGAYDDAMSAASELAVTHPIRLGLALNFSVFHYEVLNNPDEACKMAYSFRGCDRRARQRLGGELRGFHAHHAIAARQLDPVDLRPRCRSAG